MTPKIAFLDDSEDLRTMLALILKLKLGEECLTLKSVEELIVHAPEVLRTQVALLDINLGDGSPTGIDAYHWLLEQKYKGKVIFLTGHARTHPTIAKACESGADVLVKPVRTEELLAMIRPSIELESVVL